MRVEYINPFVETSYRVLKEVLGGVDVQRGDLYLKSTAMPVMGVAALVGLAGDVEGRVLFDMTFETALNIASAMNGETLTKFDDLGCKAAPFSTLPVKSMDCHNYPLMKKFGEPEHHTWSFCVKVKDIVSFE